MRAFAATMAATNTGSTNHFDPTMLEAYYGNPVVMHTVKSFSLARAQLIIADTREQAAANTEHLMQTIFSPARYRHPRFMICDISHTIDNFLNRNKRNPLQGKQFYILGGWIFCQMKDSSLVWCVLITGSSIGGSRKEAALRFVSSCFETMPAFNGKKYVGYVFKCHELTTKNLLDHSKFRMGPNASH